MEGLIKDDQKSDSLVLEDLVLRKDLLDLPEECFWMRSWAAS